MIPIKNADEIRRMRKACRIAANVLDQLAALVKPGVTTYDLDHACKDLIAGYGAVSACYNYPNGHLRFPSYVCISTNEEVVHGIGSLKRILNEGDIVSLDVSLVYDGFVGDNTRTVRVGKVSDEVDRLLNVTEQSLQLGIAQARAGNRVGDISHAIQQYVEAHGFSIVREFVGHGVGADMHEEPQIPNYGRPHSGPRLRAGMTLALEPMVNLGRPGVAIAEDGWTVYTKDRKPSAHFEHTVLVTDTGAEILTIPEKELSKDKIND